MPFDFNADEVFEIAERIEENGASFYKKAAEKLKDDHYRNLMMQLSSMEADHRKTFASMRNSLSDKEKEPAVFDPMNEAAQYLKALADLEVFYKKDFDASSVESIFLHAISLEKDSIVFYVGMKDLVPVRLGKDNIDNIISEEKKHILLLSGELKKFKE